MDAPEPYSNAWYRNRLGRIDTCLDRQDYELKVQNDKLNEQAKLIEALMADRKQDVAKIGELLGRIDAAAAVVAGLKKQLQEKNGQPT